MLSTHVYTQSGVLTRAPERMAPPSPLLGEGRQRLQAIAALIPHFQDVFEGEDPSDDSPEETVAYVIDLIGNITAYDDPIAATIHDIYRDGAEASLPHVKRAIKWHMAFDAHRRTLGAA